MSDTTTDREAFASLASTLTKTSRDRRYVPRTRQKKAGVGDGAEWQDANGRGETGVLMENNPLADGENSGGRGDTSKALLSDEEAAEVARARHEAAMQAAEEAAEEKETLRQEGLPSISDKMGYAFDNFMTQGYAAFLLIAIVCVIVIIFGGIGLYFCYPGMSVKITESMWFAWLYLLDPAAHTAEIGLPRVPGVVISILGVGVMSMLMGFVVDLVTLQMEELRKGKSKVIEKDHTLILGWSEKLPSVLRELCNAMETMPDGSEGGLVIIMADTAGESYEMMAQLDDLLPEDERLKTRFVCRTGNPMLAADLNKVAINVASSVIVLCNQEDPAPRADAVVLRVVLTVCSVLTYGDAHVVVEIRDVDSCPLLQLVGTGRCETIVSHDIIGRLMVMSVRQPGLKFIYEEILGFEGDEFYTATWPDSYGMKFEDLQEHFADAIVLGIKTCDDIVLLKPSMQRRVQAGEEIIVIAEDDDTYEFANNGDVNISPGPGTKAPPRRPERMLVCGWRRDVRDMLELVNELAPPESEVHLFCEYPIEDRNQLLEDAGLDVSLLHNLTLSHHEGHARRHLQNLPMADFTSILVVADESKEEDPMNSDSQCISNALMVRDIQMAANNMGSPSEDDYLALAQTCPLLCEVLDPRTESSIASSPALQLLSDFVQSNEMVSRVLAMVSENRSVNSILNELLGGRGCSLDLTPAKLYLNDPQEQLSWMQLSKRVMEQDEVCLGYQVRPLTSSPMDDTKVNPRDKDVPKTWGDNMLIVMRGQPFHPHLHDGPDGSSDGMPFK